MSERDTETLQLDSPPEATSDSVKWSFARRISSDMDPFWVADMDFAAPPPVLAAIRERVENGVFGYTFATDSLYDAFRNWCVRRYGYRPPESLHWFSGVMAGVRAGIRAFSAPGDCVIVQTPVYFPFSDAVTDLDRTISTNALMHDGRRYCIDFADLERKAAEGARVLLLCSPHNPVGRVWETDELSRLFEICAANDIAVISDEIHADLVLTDRPFVPAAAVAIPGLRLLTLTSATKSFNIPGLPGAFAYSTDDEMAEQFKRELSRCGGDISNALTVAATEAAFRHGAAWLESVLAYIRENEAIVRDIFSVLPVRIEPLEGTYLLWIDCSRIDENDQRLRRRLQREANVWLIEGSKFGAGGEGYVRMNIAAARPRLKAATERIAAVLASSAASIDTGGAINTGDVGDTGGAINTGDSSDAAGSTTGATE